MNLRKGASSPQPSPALAGGHQEEREKRRSPLRFRGAMRELVRGNFIAPLRSYATPAMRKSRSAFLAKDWGALTMLLLFAVGETASRSA